MTVKRTGIVRSIDELGRIVIPKELRTQFDIHEKDPLEIFVSDEGIVINKFVPGCDICGGFENMQVFRNKKFCINCINGIKEEL